MDNLKYKMNNKTSYLFMFDNLTTTTWKKMEGFPPWSVLIYFCQSFDSFPLSDTENKKKFSYFNVVWMSSAQLSNCMWKSIVIAVTNFLHSRFDTIYCRFLFDETWEQTGSQFCSENAKVFSSLQRIRFYFMLHW